MTSELDDFDLDAAWLRRAQGDHRAFMEALAVRLEGALPQHVQVERRRDGLFAKTSHVFRIAIASPKANYQLILDKGMLSGTRAKVVRGVVISTATIPVAAWVQEVRATIGVLAEEAGASTDVLQDFL